MKSLFGVGVSAGLVLMLPYSNNCYISLFYLLAFCDLGAVCLLLVVHHSLEITAMHYHFPGDKITKTSTETFRLKPLNCAL